MCTATKRAKSKFQATGQWIRTEKRLAIYKRDRFTCLICGKHTRDRMQLSLDHIIPQSKCGSNHQTNLFTCCEHCNKSRKDTPLEQFASRAAIRRVEKAIAKPIRNPLTGKIYR